MTSTDDQTRPVRSDEQSGAARMFGDFAPGLVGFTDEVLFGQVWARKELSPRDRLARRNGVTESELIETITHLAFYSGWPRAMSAMTVARQVFGDS